MRNIVCQFLCHYLIGLLTMNFQLKGRACEKWKRFRAIFFWDTISHDHFNVILIYNTRKRIVHSQHYNWIIFCNLICEKHNEKCNKLVVKSLVSCESKLVADSSKAEKGFSWLLKEIFPISQEPLLRMVFPPTGCRAELEYMRARMLWSHVRFEEVFTFAGLVALIKHKFELIGRT